MTINKHYPTGLKIMECLMLQKWSSRG